MRFIFNLIKKVFRFIFNFFMMLYDDRDRLIKAKDEHRLKYYQGRRVLRDDRHRRY